MYNFLFCINENYAKYLEVLVFSIIKNTKRGGALMSHMFFISFIANLALSAKKILRF